MIIALLRYSIYLGLKLGRLFVSRDLSFSLVYTICPSMLVHYKVLEPFVFLLFHCNVSFFISGSWTDLMLECSGRLV